MTDCFGIKKIYQDKSGGPQWDSRAWANNVARTVTSGSKDTYDPTKCSENRGNCSWSIDGQGQLSFNTKVSSGMCEPRFHLNNPSSYFFNDVEITFYAMRIADDNGATAWCGLTCGCRSGPNSHSSGGQCDCHTYYGRIRVDSNFQVEKEVWHPQSSSKGVKGTWPNSSSFPKNVWIGYKFVSCNNSAGTGINFGLYRDMTGGVNGGTWQLLYSVSDTPGSWSAPNINPPCTTYSSTYIPIKGGGVIVLRNSSQLSMNYQYKWMTVREVIGTKYTDADQYISIPKQLSLEHAETESESRCVDITDSELGECILCTDGTCSNVELVEDDQPQEHPAETDGSWNCRVL